MPTAGDRITLLADEIRALAANGLHYAHDPYDRSRYERLVGVAAELLALADTRDATEIERAFRGGLGMVTPACTASAAVFDDAGRLLLTRRADNGRWCLPGGAADVGDSPSGVAVRETYEETGLRVEARALIGVYDSRRLGSRAQAWQSFQLLFACARTGGELAVSVETTEFAWCDEPAAVALDLTAGSRVTVPDSITWYRDRTHQVFD